MTIKDRVKTLCEKQGLSVNRLEQEVGVSKGYVSKLGNSIPNTKKIGLLADRLGVTVDYLVNGDVVKTINPDGAMEEQLLLYYRKLSDIEKAEALGVLHGMSMKKGE